MIDISKITDYLYVGSRVGKDHVDELKILNFSLIISMIGQIAPEEIFNSPPFKTMWIRAYDNFFTPISLRKLILGVEAALPVIQNKEKVLVFCKQGRHRSIIMSAAILIAMGYSSEQASELLIGGRTVADPRRWYVRSQIKGFEKYWRRKHTHPTNVH